MAWNPSPEVDVARNAARLLNSSIAVVVYVRDDGKFGAASFGKTKELCKQAHVLCDFLFDSMMKHPSGGLECHDEREDLRREIQMLRDNLRSMANRVAEQSELLSRKAEKQ